MQKIALRIDLFYGVQDYQNENNEKLDCGNIISDSSALLRVSELKHEP